ncbi:hypothetical protein CAMGR0001_1003 [Campylobacter gracilis RM3268]|uniref:Uncharacterized protein n=1 Tax=Campylobacter gracilis RM3268 TaxID=553220 RepID=C8PGK8_9BACT|nr:hypothetical protein CAMGR0001_1003 [Campylobacter gracilis RM3268]
MRATQAKLKFKNNPCAENSASTKTEISSARVEFKILKYLLQCGILSARKMKFYL